MNNKTKTTWHYTLRITQRILLCMVIATTAVYWMTLISISAIAAYASHTANKVQDPSGVNQLVHDVINSQSITAMKWVVIGAAFTLLLLLVTQYRKYEKSLITDSLVVAIFCAVSLIFSQILVRSFLVSY